MKFLSPTLLACLAFAPALWGQTDPLQLGLQLFQRGQYQEALQEFEQASRLRPKDASLENFIGITETKLGRMEEARKAFQEASRIAPTLAGPHTNLGYNYLNARQYDAAEKELRTALSLDSADAYTHYYLAVLYLTTGRGAEAIPHLEPANQLLQADVPAALLAIKASLQAGALDQARRLIAVEDTQFSAAQEYELATLLTVQKLYRDAAARFQRIAQMQPSWQNQANLARAYESAGNRDLALQAWQGAIAADPSNPDLYLDCTRVLIDLDRYQEAAEIVEHGAARVPDPYPLTIRLGAIAMMSGDEEKARATYQKAIEQHPALALGYVAVAQSYMKQGNGAKALQVLTEARTLVPHDFALEYVYGLLWSQIGDREQAQQAFKSAEQMQPDVVEPHLQLGLLYMKKEAWKQAAAEFEQVLHLDPQNAPAYYQLSRTYQRLGQNEKASEMARQAGLLARTSHEEALKAKQLQFGVPRHE